MDSKESKEEEEAMQLMSSPKKRLKDALAQDAFFEKEGKVVEAQHIARAMSEVFVVKAMQSAMSNVNEVATKQ
eukprot:CAMPEP_0173193450 /NCGR_PEP_ID=MMETSP1141-20130122/13961_1 /TAXON_ID=483371 /ORGANISM="non described non described, Strain CCMP2298" /LENGTH=72 /DNA_ID=CAMNT_0014117779 /DNA_START=143 /DNA_END=361 /DNA_ORIENTATION=-